VVQHVYVLLLLAAAARVNVQLVSVAEWLDLAADMLKKLMQLLQVAQ
jgi:hypothetical protein